MLDPATGEEVSTESAPKRKPRRVTGPDGSSATMRGRVVVVRQDGEAETLTGHRDRVTSVAFSPVGTLLATTSLDHVARIWSLPANELVRALQHNTAVRDAAFSPDGTGSSPPRIAPASGTPPTASSSAGSRDTREP